MTKPPKEILWEGKHLSVSREEGWEYVERKSATGVAIILAITDDRQLILVEQFRKPVGRHMIELPAGLAGDDLEGESLAHAAKRELWEETGYEAQKMIPLMQGPSSAGLTSEMLTLFWAKDLKKSGPALGDGNECIQVHEIPIEEVELWLKAKEAEGFLIDFKIYTALFLVRNLVRLAPAKPDGSPRQGVNSLGRASHGGR